ncbi:hypothetical protein [Flavobacterium sp.]|uniref:hypothetical protein n=1 Tax=Flavobacterium sp. TaxID=239 RepID=UPI002C4F3B8C|nr:hypothetical protein [Flavobacterium sp.]HSD05841.1 hypothetical protein [Flavobacterium sp.]
MFTKSRLKNIERIGLSTLLFVLFSVNSFAQCAMCRAALGGEENKAKAAAINDGIVYLMVIPYILVGALGYYIYRMKKKKQ